MTPEGKIKQEFNKGICSLQMSYPDRIWTRMPVTRGMGLPWLDYHMCVRTRLGGRDIGITVAVEAKRDSKHDLTPQQKATKRGIEKAGGIVFVINGTGTVNIALMAIHQMLTNPEQFFLMYRCPAEQ